MAETSASRARAVADGIARTLDIAGSVARNTPVLDDTTPAEAFWKDAASLHGDAEKTLSKTIRDNCRLSKLTRRHLPSYPIVKEDAAKKVIVNIISRELRTDRTKKSLYLALRARYERLAKAARR